MNARMLSVRLVLGSVVLLTGAVPARAATFTVNSPADEIDTVPGDGICASATAVCTLRAAVMEANALPGADTITIPGGTYTLTLAGVEGPNDALPKFGDLDVTGEVTITGAGATTTIIEAGTSVATSVGRVFDVTVNALVPVSISGVTLRHGNAGSIGSVIDCGGGGIANRRNLIDQAGVVNLSDTIVTHNTAHHGGGLCNLGPGTINLLRVSVTDNLASISVGFSFGGGIKNMSGGSLFINDSTVTGNTSEGSGGGVANIFAGRFDIANSTISGNAAALNGGGLIATANSLGVLRNVTVTDNSITTPGGAIGGVAGIEAADVSIRHSVIAGNHAPSIPDCNGVATLGHNRIGVGFHAAPIPRCISAGFEPSDQQGTEAVPLDAVLGPLAYNGGPTRTHALLSGSPAIDMGDPALGCTDRFGVLFPADQRGQTRPDLAICDIGAYEKQPFVPASIVSAPATTGAGTVTFAVSAPAEFASLDPVSEADLPTEGKPATAFPFGFFSWTVTGLAPGATIVVTMTFPSPVTNPAEYWKVIGNAWTNVTSLVGDDDGDNVLTLTITDGGLGDADGTVNGRISDPGGAAPALAPAAVPFRFFAALLDAKRQRASLIAAGALGMGSNGIAPISEAVVLSIGSFTTTIPAGSFEAKPHGRFQFDGVIDGVAMKIRIVSYRRLFALSVDLHGVDLRRPGHRVPVSLTIGDDWGSTAAFKK